MLDNSTFFYFIGAWAKAGNPKKLLSEQQAHDCGPNQSGCAGGGPESAFTNALLLGGVATREEYPYVARDGKTLVVLSKYL